MKKTEKNKLVIYWVLFAISLLIVIGLAFLLEYYPMELYLQIILTIVMLVLLFIPTYMLHEFYRVVGFYKCSNCGHEFVPEKKNYLLTIHSGRSFLLTCPNCNKKTFCKKVFKSNDNGTNE